MFPARLGRLRPGAGAGAAAAMLAGLALGAEDPHADARRLMVEAVAMDAAYHGDATGRDELSGRVLAALGAVPRHLFVPAGSAAEAYENRALPVGHARTLPKPYLTAVMADLLALAPGGAVLEVGTGCGYQAAILSRLAGRVVSVEPVAALAAGAATRLARLGYPNVAVHHGEGLAGWPAEGPYDAILLTLAVSEIPPALLEQLKPGGKLLLPLAQDGSTVLTLVSKNDKGKLKPRPRPLLEVDLDPLPPPSTQ